MELLHTVLLSLCVVQFGSTQLSPTRLVNKPPIIMKQPEKEVPFRIAHSMELPCVATGFPRPEYRWKMDGKDYDPSGNAGRVAVQPGVGTLIFAEPLARDEGFYECIANNSMGSTISIKSFLRVSYLEPFPVTGTRTWTPKLGDPLTLPCISPESFPKPSLYWALLDGDRHRQIITDDRVVVDFTGALHFAHIMEFDHQNGNTYVCMANNIVTRQTEQGSYARILPQGQTPQQNPPRVVYQRSSDEVAVQGRVFSTMCVFSGNPTPIVSWYRIGSRNEKLPNNTRSDDYGQTLTFVGVRLDNAGTYQCTGQNEIGQTPIQRSVSLKVEASPEWVDGWKPQSLEVGKNESATFYCKGTGIPSPNTLWYINGKRLATTDRNPNRRIGENTLEFFNIKMSDSKVIQCNITNKHGYVFTNAYLNVMEEAPVIEDPPQINMKVAESQKVNLTCRVYGAPKPKVTWRKGNGEQLTGGRYKIFPDGNLQIEDISLVDAGQYSCTAENWIDSVEAHGNIIVRRRTLIQTRPQDVMVEEGVEAKFTCTGTTDPAEIRNMRVDWEKDGQLIDYVRAQRIFKNDVDNSLTISGTNALDTGKYTCVVSNGIDASKYGAILTVQEPPDPPEKIEVKCETQPDEDNPEISRIMAEIYWQPGRDHYAPILYYKLQYNTTFSADTWYDILPPVKERDPNSTEPYAEPLPGFLPNRTRVDYLLSPYGNYTFRILARNKVGFSEPSQHTTTVCTTEADVPYKNPENVIAEGDRPDNLVIFWTPMAEIEHNGPDFKYVISWRPADGSDGVKTQTVARKDAWHYVVEKETGMDTFKKYYVRVKAKNAKGESSSDAPWVVGYTGEGEPSEAPTELLVIPDSVMSTRADISWMQVDTSPESVRGFFRGYRIQFGRAEDWPENIIEEDVILNPGRTLYPRPRYKREIISLNTTIHYRIRGLPPNTVVRLQVRVLNKYYVSMPSGAIEFRTPEGEPGPPAKFDIVARGPTYFELEWDLPKEHNGKLTGYHISYQIVSGLNLGGLQVREAIPPFPAGERPGVRLTGLKPDTYYRVFLRASTTAGQGEPIFMDMNTLPAGMPSAPTFGITEWTNNSFVIEWEASRGNNPGSVFFVEYRIRGYYKWRRTEQIYLTNQMTVWPVESGTIYQVRVVATNGMGEEAASEWLEVMTRGQAPGRFHLSSAFWFYGIFISLVLVIVFVVLFMFAKKYTDVWYENKEEAIEEQMRQIQAEEAAMQLGFLNQDSQDPMYNQSAYPPDFKPPAGPEDRSYEVAEDEDSTTFIKNAPQYLDYPDSAAVSANQQPAHNPEYDDGPAPSYDEYMSSPTVGVHQRTKPAKPPVAPKPTDQYAVVQKGGRGRGASSGSSGVRLERSEGPERGSKDTFV